MSKGAKKGLARSNGHSFKWKHNLPPLKSPCIERILKQVSLLKGAAFLVSYFDLTEVSILNYYFSRILYFYAFASSLLIGRDYVWSTFINYPVVSRAFSTCQSPIMYARCMPPCSLQHISKCVMCIEFVSTHYSGWELDRIKA